MKKYRKKPVVVEAEVYKPGMEDGFESWCCIYGNFMKNLSPCIECDEHDDCRGNNKYLRPFIKTLEGNHFISTGDYIVTGIKGERYPVKPDIFHETYELVED